MICGASTWRGFLLQLELGPICENYVYYRRTGQGASGQEVGMALQGVCIACV